MFYSIDRCYETNYYCSTDQAQREPFLGQDQERLVQSPTTPGTALNLIRFEPQQFTTFQLVSQQMLQEPLTPPAAASPNGIPNYARVQHRHPNAEELDFHMQELPENNGSDVNVMPSRFRRTFGSDINPSVGDISDRESELDIRQLENSVSPLNGIHSSSISPPLPGTSGNQRNIDDNYRDYKRPFTPETDF